MSDPSLLEVSGLRKVFLTPGGGPPFAAVDDVSFSVAAGETFGLVGESGCGKSTAARCILRLIEPTAGSVRFEGIDVLSLRGVGLKEVRRRLQIVFQDPFSSLNPRMTIRSILLEPLEIHGVGDRKSRLARVLELLALVGLPENCLDKYPHEFSGGQRQRIGVARALALSPRLIIADEPVSALDLSIRAQVVNLLADLKDRLGLAYVFIAHDLTLVRHVCDRVAVMRGGKILEMGPTDAVFRQPAHAYTRRLLAAIPRTDPESPRVRVSEDLDEPSSGVNELREVAPGHWARA